MFSTFMSARSFTAAGDAAPNAVDRRREAALTAVGVLIPAEVVAAATAVSTFLAKKTDAGDGTATWLHLGLARWLMVVLGLVVIPMLFRVGAKSWTANGWRGLALALLTMASFAVWLALQPLSVYQGWFTVDAGTAAAVGVVGGLVIGGLAAALGWSQAGKDPRA